MSYMCVNFFTYQCLVPRGIVESDDFYCSLQTCRLYNAVIFVIQCAFTIAVFRFFFFFSLLLYIQVVSLKWLETIHKNSSCKCQFADRYITDV